jgi:hypothetical protein
VPKSEGVGQEYPYASELLYGLMQISGEDRTLPLEVLVNLHRQQLREPLVVLAGMYGATLPATDRELLEIAYRIVGELRDEYPWVVPGLRHNHWLMSTLERVDPYLEMCEQLEPMRQLRTKAPLVWALLLSAAGTGEAYDWYAHQPVAVLYPLTWGPEYYAVFLPVLDEMLRTEPSARQMILQLAGLDELAAQLPPWFDAPLLERVHRGVDLGRPLEWLLAVGELLRRAAARLRKHRV